MTEKRFRLRYDNKSDYDNIIETSDKIYTMQEVVDKLNNLSEENEQLKNRGFRMTKIDKYQGFIFDGKGYITDHQSCREVIKFNFLMTEDDKADKCMKLCLDFLNKEGMRFKNSVYDEVQNIYDYFVEVGQDDDALLIWDLAISMGFLLNKSDSND